MVTGPGAPAGLFSDAVLGTEEEVAAVLDAAYVLQHDDVNLRDGVHLRPLVDRDTFNEIYPASIFVECENGSKVIGGGMEGGAQPMGAEGGGEDGLRPLVLDTRGGDWGGRDPPPVRGLIAESPAAHRAKDCPHMFVWTNWMMNKGTCPHEAAAHLIEILVAVLTWMGVHRRHCVAHCTPLLFPLRRFIQSLRVLRLPKVFGCATLCVKWPGRSSDR